MCIIVSKEKGKSMMKKQGGKVSGLGRLKMAKNVDFESAIKEEQMRKKNNSSCSCCERL